MHISNVINYFTITSANAQCVVELLSLFYRYKFEINETKTNSVFDIQSLLNNLKEGKTTSLYKEKCIVNVRNNWIPVNTKDAACFMCENLNTWLLIKNSEESNDNYVTGIAIHASCYLL